MGNGGIKINFDFAVAYSYLCKKYQNHGEDERSYRNIRIG